MSYKKAPFQKTTSPKVFVKKPKRGPLSPLMTEDQKSSANIQDLSYDFACRITRLFQYLTEDSDYKEYIISKQVFRSGTSIGANVNEAQHPQSDADFLSKVSISLKEARETDYWIRLLQDNGYLSDTQYDSLSHDLARILKILVVLVGKVSSRLKTEGKK